MPCTSQKFKINKMKSIILMTAVALFSTAIANAQIKNATTETVKVYGNCSMCETTIEKAANNKNISKADWNEETKMATITYDSKKTTVDAVLKNMALAGYDSPKYLAPDEAYNKLPGCCKYERESKPVTKVDHSKMDHSKTAMKHDEHAGHDMQTQSKDQQEANQLQPVFDNYFSVKDALVKTDGATASAKAATLLLAIKAVKMETLKADEHTAWMEWEKNIKSHAQAISETKDVATQREHFSSLSTGIYILTKSAKSNLQVYWQNCPMFNDGKGANWLSKESAIKNPYYGSMMLTCGKTIEEIK
jgi:hypothetical protein